MSKTSAISISIRTSLLFLIAICTFVFWAQLAFADIEVSADAEVSAGATTQPSRPLKAINEAFDTRRDNAREQMASRTDAMKENVAERRQAINELSGNIKARISAAAKMQIEIVARKMKARLEAAIGRLEKISIRIDERIQKLSDEGRDMTEAVNLEAAAKAKLAEAKITVAAIVKPTPADDTREAHKAAFEALRASIKAAEDSVKSAQRAFMSVVPKLKGESEIRAHAEASTTNESN